MTFQSILEDFNSSLWGHHVKVTKEIAENFIEGNDRRVVCTLNGGKEFQCALMPNGSHFFININKKIRDQLKLKTGDAITVRLCRDDSEYGLPMPEELAELLAMDEEGHQLFHALTPGKQRNLLYIAGQPKTSDIRLKRAVVLVAHLKTHQGKINFRQLAQDLKDVNRR